MKHKNSQKGFTAIELILVVVIVIILAVGAWWIWQKNNDGGKQNAPADTSQTDKQDKSDPSEGGKYMVINEWGVRFLLPEELRGDVYYMTASNDILEAEFALFASNRLDLLTGDDACTFKNNPQASGLSAHLSRSSQKKLEEFQSPKERLVPIGNIEGTSYYYTEQLISPRITCLTGVHEEFNDVEQSISDQLREAFKTIEVIEQ